MKFSGCVDQILEQLLQIGAGPWPRANPAKINRRCRKWFHSRCRSHCGGSQETVQRAKQVAEAGVPGNEQSDAEDDCGDGEREPNQ